MITNLINYLYDINVEIVRMTNNYYLFFYNNNLYLFKETTLDENMINDIVNYLRDDMPFHTVVRNHNGKFISEYNKKKYVLMIVHFKLNRGLVLDDVLNLNKYVIKYINKNNFIWPTLWEIKIKQLEDYIKNAGINDVYILSVINYYIERGYKAINYFYSSVNEDYFPINLCHKRLPVNYDLYDFYSPDNLIFDTYIRDVANLINNKIYFDKEIDLTKYSKLLTIKEKKLLISRLMFPSFFFDIVDDFIIYNKESNEFYKYFNNISVYEKNLNELISFLQK